MQRVQKWPPSASQGLSTAESKDGHTFFSLMVNPPTSPCPILSAHSEHISEDIAGSENMKLKVLIPSCFVYISTWTKCHSEKVANIVSASLNYQLQSIA